jgi:monolysocardiolipin acyltransferase
MTGLLSTPTVVAVSLICKAILNSPFCSMTVNGLPTLMEALHSEQRQRGRGIVTGATTRSYSYCSRLISGSFKSYICVGLDLIGQVVILNRPFRLDDPLTWGVLPTRLHWSSRTTRWALGASDIMFTNPYVDRGFLHGILS